MKKLKNKKGFTLAELLIVVAIIAVLVAISIPVFGAQLKKAKHATDLANVRATYAELLVDEMVNLDKEDDDESIGKVELELDDLQAAATNGSDVAYKAGDPDATDIEGKKGMITVSLGDYEGTFLVDEDVTIKPKSTTTP